HHRLLGHEEVAADVRVDHPLEIVRRVFDERLREIDPGVVDEQVDALEVLDRRFGDLDRRVFPTDVSVDQNQIRSGSQVLGLGDRTRGGHDTIAAFEQRPGDTQPDAARSASNDGHASSHVPPPAPSYATLAFPGRWPLVTGPTSGLAPFRSPYDDCGVRRAPR